MSKDYVRLAREVDQGAQKLAKQAPGVVGAYRDLATAASTDGALTAKIKELMAVAIGIVTQCDGCVAYHTRAALRAGATREEFFETIGVAIEMGGGPAVVDGAAALDAYDQFIQDEFSSEKVG